MTAVAFDTLRFVRTLRDKATMSSEQAEVLADAVAEAIQSNLATKSDIEALRLANKVDIEALRLTNRADVAETKVEILKWVLLGAVGLQTLVIIGVVMALTPDLT